MIVASCPPTIASPSWTREPAASRSSLAKVRAGLARESLRECRLCAHDCGVNRIAGARGVCRAGPQARVFCAQIDAGDEEELVPTFAIAFSGCDLRCEFCVTRTESWNPLAGETLPPAELADRASRALASGRARTVMFLGGEPTIHLPDVLELVAAMPESARLVWKTNANCSAQARELLAGLFDVWLPDLKFGNDRCAESLAGVRDYGQVVRDNIVWAARHGEVIVRHLLMPGHLDCCWDPIAHWLGARLPGIKVSLRDGFWPRTDAPHRELRRANSTEDGRRAFALGCELGLNMVA